ncbi:hypothetical protein CVT26_010229 [Gymnopilus dilepis]|uniref:Uncharacterized protein n=1 Tax=Gymnopilus dilepis TaxID=231916 RepID=A0A409Y129_9AGAR|nr:hypothetical protein CVT26_010229 [Gymnopilus dilepis]
MAQYVTPRFMDSAVSREDIAAHLRIYGLIRSNLFILAKKHVYYDENDILWPTTEGRLFLRRSVYRFRLWIERVLRPKFEKCGPTHVGLDDHEIPPYDVALVLHAFMLHPRAFYSDTIRLFPELAVLNGFPLTQVADLITDDMVYIPKAEQVNFWESSTGEPFTAPLFTTPADSFTVTCPSCQHTFSALWMEASDDGMGSNLAAPCKQCGLLVTDLSYGAALFVSDLVRAKSGTGVGLAGTLLTEEGVLDEARSRSFTLEIARVIGLYDVEKLSLEDVISKLLSIPEDKLDSLSVDFLSFYGLPGGFSFDLGAGVLRQTGFASKMYHNGWTNPAFPKQCSAILEESISRYAGFLTLSMDRKAGSLGPAHDIDLVWHTHQLKPNYRTDFQKTFGWFLDHVDFAPIDTLGTWTMAWFSSPLLMQFGQQRPILMAAIAGR